MNDEERELVAEFEVPGEPVSKARARFSRQGGRAVTYTPQRTRDGEERIAVAYRAAGGRRSRDTEAAFAVHADFLNGTMQRRDVDNMLKLVLDGLNDVAWPDDTQVVEVVGRKRKVDKADARTVVRVYSVGTIGRPMAKCQHCGAEFRTYDSWSSGANGRKYCTAECFRAHRREGRTMTCEECGTSFLAHGPQRGAKYCSRGCKSRSGRVTIPCLVCGKEFQQYRSWVEQRPCCSRECSAKRAQQRRRDRASHYFPGTCAICGAGTTRKEYRRCNPCKLEGKEVPA